MRWSMNYAIQYAVSIQSSQRDAQNTFTVTSINLNWHLGTVCPRFHHFLAVRATMHNICQSISDRWCPPHLQRTCSDSIFISTFQLIAVHYYAVASMASCTMQSNKSEKRIKTISHIYFALEKVRLLMLFVRCACTCGNILIRPHFLFYLINFYGIFTCSCALFCKGFKYASVCARDNVRINSLFCRLKRKLLFINVDIGWRERPCYCFTSFSISFVFEVANCSITIVISIAVLVH